MITALVLASFLYLAAAIPADQLVAAWRRRRS